MGDQPWTPIGNNATKYFGGYFDGDGHTVSGLCIDATDASYQALFGYVKGATTTYAEIKNLTVSGSVTSTKVGTMVRSHTAGIVAYASYVNVDNCINNASVTSNGVSNAGGVVCYLSNCNVTNCINNGNITSDTSNIGGVVASTGSGINKVENCCNTGTVSGSGTKGYLVGGIIGSVSSGTNTINGCCNKGAVSSAGSSAATSDGTGGIVGKMGDTGNLTNCYNIGSVQAKYTAGGIVGYWTASSKASQYKLENCYNTGSVSTTDSDALQYRGGLIGYTIPSSSYQTNISYKHVINNSYALQGTATYLIGYASMYKDTDETTMLPGYTMDDKSAIKEASAMTTADFVAVLGDAYKANDGAYPLLKWEPKAVAVTHTVTFNPTGAVLLIVKPLTITAKQ